MKIKNKISLSFLFIFFGLMIIVGLGMGYFSYQAIQVESYKNLTIIGHTQAEIIDHHFKEKKEDMEIMVRDPLFEELLNSSTPSQEAVAQAEKKLNIIKNGQAEYKDVFLVDPQGETMASTQKKEGDEVYDPMSPLIAFPRENKKSYVENIVHKEENKNEFYSLLSSPVISEEDGRFLGVMITEIDLEGIYEILKTPGGKNNTKKSYLVNKKGELLNPIPFTDEGGVLGRIETNDNINTCFSKDRRSGTIKSNFFLKAFNNIIIEDSYLLSQGINFFQYNDHRGENVLGTHANIPENNWCLIITEDKNALLSSLSRFMFIYFLLAILCLLIYFLLTYLASIMITKPISSLQRGVKQIAKGDINYDIRIKSKDELGSLSRSLAKMINSIKETKEKTEKRMEQQAKKMKQKTKETENQRKAILNVLEDVEEEKEKFQKEKDKTEAVLHSIGDGVLVVDRNLNVVVFNEMAVKISGYGKDEIIGKKYNQLLKFVDEADADKNNDAFIEKAMETGKIQEMPAKTVLIAKDGKQVPVADSASPLKDKEGDIKGCVVVFQDVTKEREIDKAKTEFVSLASHQLRTPLSSINWYAEMLMDGDAGKLTKEQKEFLSEIYKGNQRMVNLVNSLLNVSRLELGTFAVDPEKVNVEKMINETLKELKQTTSEKDIKIVKNIKKKFSNYQADPNLLRIIIQNLLSNAVKYTPEKGKVKIDLNKESNGDMKFSVADNGMGIPKGQQSEIFKKLFRADNVKQTDAQGTGLGLYIVKSIVDYTGGKIWFTSTKGKGTTFHVVMPKKGMQRKEGEKKLGE